MGSGPQLSLETKSRNGVACVAVRGELDMATAARLDDCLAPYEDDGVSAIVLDLRELTFIDSFGLRALLRARDRAATDLHRLILVGANASARRLFEITHSESLLDDEDTADVLSRFVGSEDRGTGQALAAVLNVDARLA
jgi:anti-anti-sigma factor